jgi:hypothetical protein
MFLRVMLLCSDSLVYQRFKNATSKGLLNNDGRQIQFAVWDSCYHSSKRSKPTSEDFHVL